jgi:hypothetical protein
MARLCSCPILSCDGARCNAVHGKTDKAPSEPREAAVAAKSPDRLTCMHCETKFPSRTKLFKHLRGEEDPPIKPAIAVGLKVKLKETGNVCQSAQ